MAQTGEKNNVKKYGSQAGMREWYWHVEELSPAFQFSYFKIKKKVIFLENLINIKVFNMQCLRVINNIFCLQNFRLDCLNRIFILFSYVLSFTTKKMSK